MGFFVRICVSPDEIKKFTIRSLSALLLLLALLSQPHLSIAANNIITIGVLAHRPKPETQARFQPLVKHLSQELSDYQIRLNVYSYPELEAALAANRLDFVLTNPGHYIQLRHQNGLSGALATLIEQEGGQAISFLGGVIFSRSDRTDIVRLEHLKGKRIATVGTGSLGGYQAQAFELIQAGVHLPDDATILITGMPHDTAVQSVLDGRTDAGMVRTGVLEEMAKEGKLDLTLLKILNLEKQTNFPYASSTRLYPQWPFLALPHVPEELARQVAAALLGMPHINQLNGLNGFTIPADYTSVENLLRELRQPPFDKAPRFTLNDIWNQYHWQILAALLASGIILLLGMRLIIANRKLIDSEMRYRTVADFTSEWEYWQTPDGKFQYMSPSCEQVCGYTAEEFYRNPQLLAKIVHTEDLHRYTNHTHHISENNRPEPIDFRIITRDGHERWISHICRTIIAADGIKSLGQRASNRDITERVRSELILRNIAKGVAAKVGNEFFSSLAIYLTEALDIDYALIGELNETRDKIKTLAFCRAGQIRDNFEYRLANTPCARTIADKITVYSSDVRNLFPDDVDLQKLGIESYCGVALTDSKGTDIGVLCTFHSQPINQPAMVSDINRIFASRASAELERLRNEQIIHDMAFQDPLTGLSNRRHFKDRLNLAIADSRRYDRKFALMMIDLDHYKEINDELGHEAGDKVLIEVADRLKSCFEREQDSISRFGGDEFCIIITDIGSGLTISTLADKLLAVFSLPFLVDGKELLVTISMGISIYPDNGNEAKLLESAADKAMYDSKEAGRNTWRFSKESSAKRNP